MSIYITTLQVNKIMACLFWIISCKCCQNLLYLQFVNHNWVYICWFLYIFEILKMMFTLHHIWV
jgi:hypothetical protein